MVHNAFRAGFGATGWDLKSVLWALYQIFHETPAMREDFTAITRTTVFPMKFCVHRWVENAQVTSRALLVLGHVRKYVDTITKHPKKYNVPDGKAFMTVKSDCADSLMSAHLMFFESVARQFDQFLVRYQTDKPMVPFLCGDIGVTV